MSNDFIDELRESAKRKRKEQDVQFDLDRQEAKRKRREQDVQDYSDR